MAKGTRTRRRFASRQYRSIPYPLRSRTLKSPPKEAKHKKSTKALEKSDWEDATCSVCMEFPHNAVLLLCSSHDKGCRPYMCGTSYRYSNCLDQFKKAYTKETSPHDEQAPPQEEEALWEMPSPTEGPSLTLLGEKCEVMELACPLCRGQVKGWTVVECAREYLNNKKRNCMQDECLFVGTFKELRKHMKTEHPSARPREVDPALEQKWRRLERERERDDVISTIRSSMPGAMVLGDYVIESNHNNSNGFDDSEDEDDEVVDDDGRDYDESNWLHVLFLLQAFGNSGNVSFRSRLRRLHRGYRSLEDDGGMRGGGAGIPPNNAVAAAGASSAASEGEEGESAVSRRGRVAGVGRAEGRRRRRSRRRSVIDVT
eukprot:TRINITY_DN21351_c0_g1_i1.p1 TRINITY_DN21351_c0_g1~~TRINITY_DN21351_c0_g1_i1.p1  ORF type:complete len:372 (-),score=53.79 TRINITY_DN21351_c0_g1_i1:298-1413(-)